MSSPSVFSIQYYRQHYLNPRVLSMLFFGISAGVPYLLITSTFYQWLLEEGLSQAVITSFSVYTLPLSVKFFWSHWVDHLKIPVLRRLGQYRSWFVLSQLGVMGSLIWLSQVVANENLYLTAFSVLLVSFFSATQDITLGAYRVSVLSKEQQSFGSSQIVIGYRVGILMSGGGALYLSTRFGWSTVYFLLALVQIQGIITVLLNPEPASTQIKRKSIKYFEINKVFKVLYSEFFRKPGWALFLVYIFIFKFGDATLNTFTWIFFRDIGFTKEEISLSVSLGFFANALGATVSGWFIDQFRIKFNLYSSAVLQILVFITLWIQAAFPKNDALMMTTIIMENFVCGFAATCIYTLFAYKVSKRFSAIQYTFFASFASLSKIVIASLGGRLLPYLDWSIFFALMFFAPIVSFYIIYKLYESSSKNIS